MHLSQKKISFDKGSLIREQVVRKTLDAVRKTDLHFSKKNAIFVAVLIIDDLP